MPTLITDATAAATPIHVADATDWPALRGRLPRTAGAFAEAVQFEAKPGRHLLLPGERGGLDSVVFIEDRSKPQAERAFTRGGLASLLPAGLYRFEGELPAPGLAALAWLTELYRFDTYR